MTAAVLGAVRGRPTNSTLSERLHRSRLRNVVLTDELAALSAERFEVATEIRALSARIQLSINAQRPDIAMHVAGRLDALGESLLRRSAA